MLTIFSSPKPFRGHIEVIQRNAILSWLQLGPEVEVILIGDESGLAEAAAEFGVEHISQVDRNELGTPLLNSIFAAAAYASTAQTLCYVNADILFMDDLLPTIRQVSNRFSQYLLLGQRWDLDVQTSLQFENGWQDALRTQISEGGRRHPPAGSDYFVFPKGLFKHLPAFALGRAGWDNWMIYSARARQIPVVDASQAITIVHQDHTYGHLPGGQPHYRLPETEGNVRLAGGRETIFSVHDADWVLEEDTIKPRPIFHRLRPRALEAALIARIGPGKLSRTITVVFHPLEQLRYLLSKPKRKGKERSSPEDQAEVR